MDASAPTILSDIPGSFPESVLRERHPAIIAQVLASTPYPPSMEQALLELRDEEIIAALPEAAEDREIWRDWIGHRWLDAPFLWAESYFYRRLLEAVGYFTAGPWSGLDPFAPQKSQELSTVPPVRPLSRPDLLLASVWGNRADLGFRLSRTAGHTPDDDLLVDDGEAFWAHLTGSAPGRVCLIADNAGPELLPDLMLLEHFLSSGLATRVDLHLKPHPHFVSDATTADLLACLPLAPAAADALRSGTLTVHTHPFYCHPLSYRHLPTDLAASLTGATVTILKGDLNYRRLVSDRRWPADTPFADLTAYFPTPVLALRTIKSEVLVGAPDATTGDQSWRVRGTRALIQFRP